MAGKSSLTFLIFLTLLCARSAPAAHAARPTMTAEIFAKLPETAQLKWINAYQTFVLQLQWEAGAVPQFKDGDYVAEAQQPYVRLFPSAVAQSATCAPIFQKTCVIAGNLSEMRAQAKPNGDGKEVCAGYFCSKQGFAQGCDPGEVRCNPLLFVSAAGKSFCVKTSEPLGVTATCQAKTDRKELIDMLKKKLADPEEKKKYDAMEARIKAYCKNPHWHDRDKNTNRGACDVLENSLVDVWLGVKNETERDQRDQASEKTACIYEMDDGRIGKVTVKRDRSGNITSAQMYSHTRGTGRTLSGWLPGANTKFSGSEKLADGRSKLKFSFTGLPPYPKVNGRPLSSSISFIAGKNQPSTCGFQGFQMGSDEIPLPLKSLRDPSLAAQLDESVYLGEMDSILGMHMDRSYEHQKTISEAIVLVKSRKGCKTTAIFGTGSGGILAPVVPGQKSFELNLEQVRDGRRFEGKSVYKAEVTCKGDGDWFQMSAVKIAGCLTVKGSEKNLFMDLQQRFCSGTSAPGSSGGSPVGGKGLREKQN